MQNIGFINERFVFNSRIQLNANGLIIKIPVIINNALNLTSIINNVSQFDTVFYKRIDSFVKLKT